MVVRRFASVVAAVLVLGIPAAPAMAEPNPNACTGQALKEASLTNGGAGQAIGDFGGVPADLGEDIAGLNKQCHEGLRHLRF